MQCGPWLPVQRGLLVGPCGVSQAPVSGLAGPWGFQVGGPELPLVREEVHGEGVWLLEGQAWI